MIERNRRQLLRWCNCDRSSVFYEFVFILGFFYFTQTDSALAMPVGEAEAEAVVSRCMFPPVKTLFGSTPQGSDDAQRFSIRPGDLAIEPDGGRLYFSDERSIRVIDTSTFSVLHRKELPRMNPEGYMSVKEPDRTEFDHVFSMPRMREWYAIKGYRDHPHEAVFWYGQHGLYTLRGERAELVYRRQNSSGIASTVIGDVAYRKVFSGDEASLLHFSLKFSGDIDVSPNKNCRTGSNCFDLESRAWVGFKPVTKVYESGRKSSSTVDTSAATAYCCTRAGGSSDIDNGDLFSKREDNYNNTYYDFKIYSYDDYKKYLDLIPVHQKGEYVRGELYEDSAGSDVAEVAGVSTVAGMNDIVYTAQAFSDTGVVVTSRRSPRKTDDHLRRWRVNIEVARSNNSEACIRPELALSKNYIYLSYCSSVLILSHDNGGMVAQFNMSENVYGLVVGGDDSAYTLSKTGLHQFMHTHRKFELKTYSIDPLKPARSLLLVEPHHVLLIGVVNSRQPLNGREALLALQNRYSDEHCVNEGFYPYKEAKNRDPGLYAIS